MEVPPVSVGPTFPTPAPPGEEEGVKEGGGVTLPGKVGVGVRERGELGDSVRENTEEGVLCTPVEVALGPEPDLVPTVEGVEVRVELGEEEGQGEEEGELLFLSLEGVFKRRDALGFSREGVEERVDRPP